LNLIYKTLTVLSFCFIGVHELVQLNQSKVKVALAVNLYWTKPVYFRRLSLNFVFKFKLQHFV